MTSYLYLFAAIVFEVVATTTLRSTDGFTRLWPSVATVIGYGLSFYFLSLCLRYIPMAISYAIWSGVGLILITIAGWVLYQQRLDLPAFLGMSLILAGVLVIHFFSAAAPT